MLHRLILFHGSALCPKFCAKFFCFPDWITQNNNTTYFWLTALNSIQGYASDHEQIQLLRLRTFHVGKHLPDSLFSDADAQDQIAALVGVMRPFVSFNCSYVLLVVGSRVPLLLLFPFMLLSLSSSLVSAWPLVERPIGFGSIMS